MSHHEDAYNPDTECRYCGDQQVRGCYCETADCAGTCLECNGTGFVSDAEGALECKECAE